MNEDEVSHPGPVPCPAYVALGANLGDRDKNLRDALTMLDASSGLKLTRISSFIENPAVGGPPASPPFINAVAEVETTLTPQQLLDRLLEIERELGRQRREKWGPRNIDLDLLMYSDTVLATPKLTIPHPRLHERRFVLQPLAEIAPDLMVPGLDATVAELLRRLPS